MRMLKHFWLAGMLLAVTGCGAGLQGEGHLSADIDFPAGFEIVDSGETAKIEIYANAVTFTNQAGAPQARVHGYEVQVFDASGNIVAQADTIGMERSFQVHVPAGIRCAEEDAACDEPGTFVLADSYSEPRPLLLIASFVPTYMLDNDLHTVKLRVTFYYDQGAAKNRSLSVGVPVVYPRGESG